MADNPTTLAEPIDDVDAMTSGPVPIEEGVAEDVLVEEVSIDGMCGVY